MLRNNSELRETKHSTVGRYLKIPTRFSKAPPGFRSSKVK
jgi:hypothetical protein